MANQYKGVHEAKIAGNTYQMCYDWNALATVKSEFTDADLENPLAMCPLRLARLAEIGLQKYHKDFTKEKLIELSPPVLEVATAIDRAILVGRIGPEGAQQILQVMDEANKAQNPDTESEKKTESATKPKKKKMK